MSHNTAPICPHPLQSWPREHNILVSRKARGPRGILAAATLEPERSMPGLPGNSLLGEVRRPLCLPWLSCLGLWTPCCVLDRDGFGQALMRVEAKWTRPPCPRSCWGCWGHIPFLQVPLGLDYLISATCYYDESQKDWPIKIGSSFVSPCHPSPCHGAHLRL